MHTDKRFDDGLYWKIVKSWPLIVSIVALLVGYGILRAQMGTLETKSVDNVIDHKYYEEKLSQHDDRIARVEEAVSQMPEIRADIKSILREMKK